MEENLAIFQDRKMESSLILFIYKGLQRGCNSYYISRQGYIVLNHIFLENVVFRIVQYMSEPSLESNRMPDQLVHSGPLQKTHKSLCT